MAETSDDKDDAPMPDAPPEPPGVYTPDVELGALHRSAPRVRRWTTLSFYNMYNHHHIASSLSVVSRVCCLVCPVCPVCPGPHLCFSVLTTSRWLPDSDKEFFFFEWKRFPHKMLTQGYFCAVLYTVFGGDS